MARPSRWPEIVRVSGEMFRERGYDATSMEDIAQAVGILKGSLYNYVNSKEDLLQAVLVAPADELLEELDSLFAQDLPANERLRGYFRAQVVNFGKYYPAPFVYLQQIGRATHREDFKRRDERYMAELEQLITEGVKTGEFALAAKPRMAARSIVGMLGWMQHWYEPEGYEADLKLADELYGLAISGLGGGPKPPAARRRTPRTS